MTVSSFMVISGSDLAFIYPDYETAYVGRFENLVMRGAQVSEAVGHRCNEHGLMEVAFAEASGPLIEYWPPTNTSFGAGPEVFLNQFNSFGTRPGYFFFFK